MSEGSLARRGRGLNEDERVMLDAMERGGSLSEMDRGKLRAYSMFGNQIERQRIERLTGPPKTSHGDRGGSDGNPTERLPHRSLLRKEVRDEFDAEYSKALKELFKELGL